MAAKRKILGLDIGRATVKAVWATVRGTAAPQIVRSELLRLPAETADRKNVIAQWLARFGVHGTPTVIGLSGQQAMFQPLVLLPGDPRTAQQVAAIEMFRFNEMASEEMAYACAPFTNPAGDRRVLLAMARPGALTEVLDAARGLGLRVVDLVPLPVAVFNAFALHAEESPAPILYADVGQSGTEMAVGTAHGLMFARHFAIGGQAFTDAVARSRKLAYVQAETLKVSKGALTDDDTDLGPALRKTADLWVSELQSCLSVYGSVFGQPHDRPRRLIVCGGGALLPGFAEYVSGKLGMETALQAPLPLESGTENPALYAAATGLALTGLKRGLSPLNLLPEDTRDELVFRAEKPYWIAAGVAAALILGVSVGGGFWDFQRKAKLLKEQGLSLHHRQELVSEIERLKAQAAAIRTMTEPVRQMLANAARLRDVLRVVAEARDANDWIILICDADAYYAQPEPPADAARAALGAGAPRRLTRAKRPGLSEADRDTVPLALEHVIIEGYTRSTNLATVQKLIEDLKQAGFIASADLLSDDKLVPREDWDEALRRGKARRFVIDVKLTPL